MKKAPSLLATPIVDLLPTFEEQMPYARKALGTEASEEDVLKEAQRRAARALELRAALEKQLGTASRPYPMWGSQRVEAGNTTLIQHHLSFVGSDTEPLKVYSTRSDREIMALAYCDMPVPSMLPLFFDGLERRKPESANRTQMLIGNPGHGKSFMGALHGRLRAPGPVEVYDCGGKSMNDLLFEMVLDFGAGDALPTAIDKRLKAGTLEALSVSKLKQLPGKAVSMDADGNIQSIDWNYYKGAATIEEVDQTFTLLKDISKIERLDGAGGNALGMNSQYGALVRAFLENREIVLDEYNKSREGSDNALQTVWQFLNGEKDDCTVDNPLKNKDAASGPSSFTFRREDVGIGFFVTLTGNKTEDGVTTRSLNKSVYSRLSPDTLPDPGEIDWQHRICQMMAGVPVSTLYTIFQEQADANPAAFGNWLLSLRREKARIEGVAVPELQETLLLNWRNVVSASEKLGKFYEIWSTVTDCEKLVTAGYSDLVMEVDEEYSKKEGVDFRKIKQHLEWAIPIRPRMEPYEAPAFLDLKNFWNAPPPVARNAENPALGFGTRLVEYLERVVYEKSEAIGKPKLYKHLQEAIKNCELRDISLAEGEHSAQKSVEECLNISSFNDGDLRKQAIMARKIICDYLRSRNPDFSSDDEYIITVEKLRKAMEWVKEKNTALAKEMFIINSDQETLGAKPFAPIHVFDEANLGATGEAPQCLEPSDLVTHEDLLVSLALPTIGKKNMEAIWDSHLRNHWDDTANDNKSGARASQQKLEEAMRVVENASQTGFAFTTLCVNFKDAAGDERDVRVHILRDTQRDKTLIIGEKVSSRLQAAFAEAGITHVDRNDASAAAKVDAAVRNMIRNAPATMVRDLTDAFLYLNPKASTEAQQELKNLYDKSQNDNKKIDLKRGSVLLANLLVKPGESLESEDREEMAKILVKGRPKP